MSDVPAVGPRWSPGRTETDRQARPALVALSLVIIDRGGRRKGSPRYALV